MFRNYVTAIPAIFAMLFAGNLLAKVSPEDAAKLAVEGTELTPMGAVRAGNKDGSIPAWTGGLAQPPDGYKEGGWYVDPYADDKVLFTITATNYQQYADRLTPGQIAMLKKYPDSYKMNIYPTRRSAAFPKWHYENTIWNASHTEWCNPPPGPNREERCLAAGTWKSGTFFPIPKDAGEAMFNHTFFYIGKGYTALANGFNAFADGSYASHVKRDRFFFPMWMPEAERPKEETFTRKGGAGLCFSQEDIAPPRTAGGIFGACIYFQDTGLSTYLYVPGQRRVRIAPEIGFYDSPGTGSDGLRTADSRWMFFTTGSEEWYSFAPLVRKEIYVPYNSYKIAQPGLTFDDIIKPGHVNSDLKRYELHRVWVIEATLKPGFRHLSPHRFAYFDEDSWVGALGDIYDARGDLWRVSEAYSMNFYNLPAIVWWGEAHMDVINGRYSSANAWYNEGARQGTFPPNYKKMPDPALFTPAGLRKYGVR